MTAQRPPEDKQLAKKIAELEESISRIREGYGEFGQYMEVLREISARYFRLMELYSKHGGISADMAVPEIKDTISKEIIRILVDRADKGGSGLNLSDITRELKMRRGTASRRIVRERVKGLVERGIVKRTSKEKQPSYTISEELIDRWYDLLGLGKR